MNKQHRLGGYNFVVSAPVAELFDNTERECCSVLGHGVFKIFRLEALEVSTRPQAHYRCTTPHLKDSVTNELRSARTPALTSRAISNEIVSASRGHRPRRGVRGDVGNEKVHARWFQSCLHRQERSCGLRRPRSEDRASTSGAIYENGHCEHRVAACFLATDAGVHGPDAHVVGRSLAKRKQRAGGRRVVSVVAATNKRSEGSIIKKRRAVRSAWTTFISDQSAGEEAIFRKLTDEYRNISAEEDQRLQARVSLVVT